MPPYFYLLGWDAFIGTRVPDPESNKLIVLFSMRNASEKNLRQATTAMNSHPPRESNWVHFVEWPDRALLCRRPHPPH
jgi:hypothetical protein